MTILRMIDLRSSSFSPDSSPLTRNPVPTGLATGNSAMKADMNVNRNPSFNILRFGTLYCRLDSSKNRSKPFRFAGGAISPGGGSRSVPGPRVIPVSNDDNNRRPEK